MSQPLSTSTRSPKLTSKDSKRSTVTAGLPSLPGQRGATNSSGSLRKSSLTSTDIHTIANINDDPVQSHTSKQKGTSGGCPGAEISSLASLTNNTNKSVQSVDSASLRRVSGSIDMGHCLNETESGAKHDSQSVKSSLGSVEKCSDAGRETPPLNSRGLASSTGLQRSSIQTGRGKDSGSVAKKGGKIANGNNSASRGAYGIGKTTTNSDDKLDGRGTGKQVSNFRKQEVDNHHNTERQERGRRSEVNNSFHKRNDNNSKSRSRSNSTCSNSSSRGSSRHQSLGYDDRNDERVRKNGSEDYSDSYTQRNEDIRRDVEDRDSHMYESGSDRYPKPPESSRSQISHRRKGSASGQTLFQNSSATESPQISITRRSDTGSPPTYSAFSYRTEYESKVDDDKKMLAVSNSSLYDTNQTINFRRLSHEVSDILHKAPRAPPPEIAAKVLAKKKQEKARQRSIYISRARQRSINSPSDVDSLNGSPQDFNYSSDEYVNEEDLDRNIEQELLYGGEFESKKAHARHRWKFVLTFVIKLLRATAIFRNVDLKTEEKIEAYQKSEFEALGLTYLLKSHQDKSDIVYSSKVQTILSEDRTDQVILTLQRLLSIRMKSFNKFTPDQQRQLCATMQFESRPTSKILFREGHIAWGFYFILSGQVEIYKTKKDMKHKLNILNSGDCFGEREEGELRRSYTVVCTMPTELLRIERDDYETIMELANSKNIATRVTALNSIPHFQSTPPSILEKLAMAAQMLTFQPQEPIIHEGVENFSIFWIITGSCRAMKLVPFVKVQTTPDFATHSKKFTLIAFESGVTELNSGDEIVMQLLTIRELTPGSHFPEFVGGVDAEKFNRIELLARLGSDDHRLDARAYVSVVANTKVEIIGMTRVDYVRIATTEMITRVLADRVLLHVPLQQLQESMIEKRNWELFKKRQMKSRGKY